MFTGIIEAVGQVTAVIDLPSQGRTLKIEHPFQDLQLGDSVAINGVCLTVANLPQTEFFLSIETLEKSNLKLIKLGDRVNLERALLPTTRLSGHLVQGHVDGQARIESIIPTGECFELRLRVPRSHLKYTVEKGSIALDGISLTINRIQDDLLSFMIIPHTWQHTALSQRQPGDLLNFEVDIIAKYAERLCTPFLK